METEGKNRNGKLSWGTRAAYAGGDVACNVIFGMVGTLLTLFYTDYVGVNPAAVGMVMLISRLFDGVSDMVMGVIVEKTHSRWGKSRPWILWMSVPYALSAVLILAAVAMAVLGTARSYGATAAVIAVYGCYGGIMGSFPAFTSSIFGIRHTGENYGYVMLGIVIATFAAPGITRLLTGNGLGMQAVFLTGVAFAVLAFVCLTLLERELKKGENTWH